MIILRLSAKKIVKGLIYVNVDAASYTQNVVQEREVPKMLTAKKNIILLFFTTRLTRDTFTLLTDLLIFVYVRSDNLFV